MTEAEIEEAYTQVDAKLLETIRKAIVNIRTYHEKQKQYSWFDSENNGTLLGQKVTPLAKLGVYVTQRERCIRQLWLRQRKPV